MAGPGRLGVGVGVAGAALELQAASSSARPQASVDRGRLKLFNRSRQYKKRR
jgi:hypothetical protein